MPDLSGGLDPDDAFSKVPYERGFYFLSYLQSVRLIILNWRYQDNLKALRSGILDLESRGGNSQSQAQTEAVKLLRKQYERMRGMLLAEGGERGVDVPR